MTDLAALWLPILLSAVFVFVASSIIHMALPIHRSDYRKMPNEDAARAALRDAKIPPGQYMFPNADSMKECGTPEMQAKFNEGPVGLLIMRADGMPNIGPALLQWFLFSVVISVFAGYLTGVSIAPGADYMVVFRISGAVAMLGYAFSTVHDSIWKSVPWSITGKFVLDGVVYALVTAGTFAWLWPDAA